MESLVWDHLIDIEWYQITDNSFIIYKRTWKLVVLWLLPKSTFMILNQNMWLFIKIKTFLKNAFLENEMVILGSSNKSKHT